MCCRSLEAGPHPRHRLRLRLYRMVLFQAASVRPLGTGCHTGIGTGGVRTPALSGAGTSRGGARMSGTGAAGEGWRGSARGASQAKLKEDSL